MQGASIAERGEDSSTLLLTRWRLPTEPPALPDAQGLHLWLIALDRNESPFLQSLSADELARGERFASRDAARRFTVARGATRTILGQYLDTEGKGLELAYGPLGKPEMRRSPCELHFNLSHAGERALLAVRSGAAVGVDLEPIRPRANLRQIADRVFDRETAQSLSGLEGEALVRAFIRRWTELEARAKTLGKGVFNRDTSALPCIGFQPLEGWIGAVASIPDVPPLDDWGLFLFQ